MQLIGHSAAGVLAVVALEQVFPGATNPVVAFGIGWLSHYAVDFFPHGDEGVGKWVEKGNQVKRFALIAGVDGALTVATLGIWWAVNGSLPLWVAAAAFGSWVPDGMWGLEMLVGRLLFGPHQKLHNANHNHLKVVIPSRYGIPAQAVVTVAAWHWLIVR